ncbi:MAG: class I SAM-dependent DNA methyltransferase [Nocardioidaceae bacterium]
MTAASGSDGIAGGRVQATYDAVARAYDAQLGSELDGKPLDRALLEGFAELVGDGTLADVGCGPGHVTRYLAARHADVVGIDLSPVMIEVARERTPDVPFAVGSMLRLPAIDDAWGGRDRALLDHSPHRRRASHRLSGARQGRTQRRLAAGRVPHRQS